MLEVNIGRNLNVSSHTTINTPSSSTNQPILDLALQPASLPTLLLDSIILKEVCENIFEDLNKLVKTRNDLIHTGKYEDKWTALRERVDRVMCELHKLSIEAQNQSLNNWFKEVVNNVKPRFPNIKISYKSEY